MEKLEVVGEEYILESPFCVEKQYFAKIHSIHVTGAFCSSLQSALVLGGFFCSGGSFFLGGGGCSVFF